MGLDIVVYANVDDVCEVISACENGVKDKELALELLKKFKGKDSIGTRPGSYGGLHVVRRKFTDFMKIESEPDFIHSKGIPVAHEPFHLLNHSDCDGWYLPESFFKPVWCDYVSIGSSVSLLGELESIAPDQSEDWFSKWAALYVPAVASMVSGRPIKFC